MTTSHDPETRVRDPYQPPEPDKSQKHRGHGWMMIVCCIPMLVIAVALVATGVVSSGFLIGAVMCTVMMALMMRGMHGDSRM